MMRRKRNQAVSALNPLVKSEFKLSTIKIVTHWHLQIARVKCFVSLLLLFSSSFSFGFAG